MDFPILYIAIVVSIAPMVALLAFIWWFDRYDREPLRFVLVAFLWGGFGAVALTFIADEIIFKIYHDAIVSMYIKGFNASAVIVAPVVEELMKGLIVFFLLRYRNFDNVTDGLVYGAAAGLGFAMTENFIYYTLYTDFHSMGYEWLYTIYLRSMFSANVHCAASATFGAGIAKLKEHGIKGIVYVLGAFTAAVLIHATWNYLLTTGDVEDAAMGVFVLIIYIAVIFIIFVFGIRGERKQREKVLQEEFDLGVLPEKFKKTLMSYWAMKKSGWFPESLNKDKYLRLVSKLSLRKTSYFKAAGKRKEILHQEIIETRLELKEFSELINRVSKDSEKS